MVGTNFLVHPVLVVCLGFLGLGGTVVGANFLMHPVSVGCSTPRIPKTWRDCGRA